MLRPLPTSTALAAALLAAAMAAPVRAADDCLPGLDLREPMAAPRLFTVRPGMERLHFAKSGPVCPSMAKECQERAYLVAGDTVAVTRTVGDYACAVFTGGPPRFRATSGWLPSSGLTDSLPPVPRPNDWAGDWASGTEQMITIRAVGDGRIAIDGNATWGASDPARLASGGVHIGGFEGMVRPDGQRAAVAPDGEDGCRVRLWLLGPLLAAADNNQCGGLNVTFTGVYRPSKGR